MCACVYIDLPVAARVAAVCLLLYWCRNPNKEEFDGLMQATADVVLAFSSIVQGSSLWVAKFGQPSKIVPSQ